MPNKKINLFIDTNIWLSIYEPSSDDLILFKQISKLISTKFNLIITEQIYDEFWRNRENKIKEIINMFSNGKYSFSAGFPNIIRGYKEFYELNEKYEEFNNLFNKFHKNMLNDINAIATPADKLIKLFLIKNKDYLITEEIVNNAELRYKRGNPPGKNNMLGDAINWELLLKNVPKGEDLYIISKDKDYRSCLDEKELNFYLKQEWKTTKKSDIIFYNSLSSFINKHIPEAKNIDIVRQEELVNELRNSKSYKESHEIIKKLEKFKYWNNADVIELCEIAIKNNQINDIFQDDDIWGFYNNLIINRFPLFNNEYVSQVLTLIWQDQVGEQWN